VRSGERGRGRFNGFRFCALPLAFFYDINARPRADLFTRRRGRPAAAATLGQLVAWLLQWRT
jgi:hypothetical protein